MVSKSELTANQDVNSDLRDDVQELGVEMSMHNLIIFIATIHNKFNTIFESQKGEVRPVDVHTNLKLLKVKKPSDINKIADTFTIGSNNPTSREGGIFILCYRIHNKAKSIR